MKTAKKSGWIRVCSVLIFLPASLTWTDGGYVSSRISESLAVSADQRAILIKNGNDISMTFSTGYTGEGEDFGWIIPISVPPAIEDIAESGKDGIASFAFLDEITAPVIVTEIYSHKGCFPAGTTVHTAEGSRVIEAVSPGTEVYACDPTTGKWVLAKVLKLQSFQWEGDMVTVQMGRYSIQTTGNQPIYVVSGDRLSSRPIPGEVSIEDQRSTGPGRWVEARNLEKGDRLKDRKGNGQVITGLSSQYQKTRVYCLEVEHYHNCAVHSAGILAHNGGKQGKSEEVNLMPLVTVYGKVILEHYEVTVLGADDASALLEWLQENDYQVSLEARSIFENYLERKWAFVAVKLNPSQRRHYENEFLSPLTIRYRYDQLIFPLRISSISTTQNVRITLYVIAESTVWSPNFETTNLDYDKSFGSPEIIEDFIRNTIGAGGRGLVVLWSGHLCPEAYPDINRQYSSEVEIIDRLCRSPLPSCQMYLTRLETRMDPANMSEDIWLTSSLLNDFDVRFHSGTRGTPTRQFPRDSEPTPTKTVVGKIHVVPDSEDIPKLIIAARDRDDEAETVQRLLDAGADVNQKGMDGWTSLMQAAFHGNIKVIKVLLQAGADINVLQNRPTATELMNPPPPLLLRRLSRSFADEPDHDTTDSLFHNVPGGVYQSDGKGRIPGRGHNELYRKNFLAFIPLPLSQSLFSFHETGYFEWKQERCPKTTTF